ncbi:hypothetical protein BKP37_07945 [Anaerobacillus alkalilacustris]|uniref:HTH lacI-type domain-containing protein n=1 Tax=Anaerobacillus alkalilacustris TaxID=393763 RepID=A0A1S2LQS4_9BACI|nr:LacI family DNA-binding transcriptional regulator [Anaerobacillus alkalilacustris]OIJ14684.1 hypothetical protein BKP37_07945 [Anaerobacillus alkalilacustris]
MSITIKDIANAAGVSDSTVSKALRDSPLVQDKTKSNILKIAHEFGYQPNVVARSLVSKKTNTVGVVWPTIERATPSALITIITEELEKHSYSTLLAINKVTSSIETFSQFQVDAILIFNDQKNEINHRAVLRSNVPTLCYGIANQSPYPTVDVNRRLAIQMAVQHLISIGHTNIAYIGDLSKNDPMQEEKVIGFMQEMKKNGILRFENMVETNGLDQYDGYLAMKSVLKQEVLPTAIISGSYDLTKGIMKAISETKLRVPKDLSIIGYDIVPKRDLRDLEISIVGVPLPKIKDKVVETLLKITGNQVIDLAIKLEPELRITNSCASPRT